MTGADAEEATPPEAADTGADAPAQGSFELAANGRARCRACGQSLSKGEWRLGERTKNPFGEGETTYWFHPQCGASRRPDVFLAACSAAREVGQSLPFQDWVTTAEFGSEHHRASRFAGIGVAPSGRARCRHCRELIDKGVVRIELSIFNDGRFDPMGYLHPKCLTEYVGVKVPFGRLSRLCEGLSEEQRKTLEDVCSTDNSDASA